MPEQVPPAVSQSFNLLLPIMIVLAVTGVLNFIFNNITSDGIQVLIYNMIQAPLTSLGSSMGTIIVFVVVQQFMGFRNPWSKHFKCITFSDLYRTTKYELSLCSRTWNCMGCPLSN